MFLVTLRSLNQRRGNHPGAYLSNLPYTTLSPFAKLVINLVSFSLLVDRKVLKHVQIAKESFFSLLE